MINIYISGIWKRGPGLQLSVGTAWPSSLRVLTSPCTEFWIRVDIETDPDPTSLKNRPFIFLFKICR